MAPHEVSQAFIYLLAAVISVPLAKRLGLGSVLGISVGRSRDRSVLLRIGSGPEGQDVMHVAEFGVVMMLFVIGLETAAGDSVAHARTDPRPGRRASSWDGGCGFRPCAPFARAVADRDRGRLHPGDVFDRDCAAVAEREKPDEDCRGQGVVRGPFVPGHRCSSDPRVAPAACDGTANREEPFHGQLARTFTCVATYSRCRGRDSRGYPRWPISAAAILPLHRSDPSPGDVYGHGFATCCRDRPAHAKGGLIARTRSLLAGVVLAESEYRHQLETDIEPFKGLLLGLFFISVGAGINFALIAGSPGIVASLVVAILVVKFLVLLAVSRYSRLEPTQRYLFAFALAQGGEFAFVLCSFATQNGVLTSDIANLLVVTVALTMAAAPILMTINERLVQPRFASVLPEREPDEIEERDNPVLVAGVRPFWPYRGASAALERLWHNCA